MEFSGKRVFLVGIKGTGMASLAALLKTFGASVSGCDVPEHFLTDALLCHHGIPVEEGFSPSLLDDGLALVVHSTAYPLSLPILIQASALGLEIYSYPQFLAFLSSESDSYAVAGTHGKTSTVATTSFLLSTGTLTTFPFYSIFGSQLQHASTVPCQGTSIALFEACEYQDHFLSYHLRGALVTNIELDHPDFFPSEAAVQQSFEKFVDNLAKGGFLICCSDDPGSRRLAAYCRHHRKDLTLLTYGFQDSGPFRIMQNSYGGGYTLSCLEGGSFTTTVNERALVGNQVGSVILALSMILDRENPKLYLESGTLITAEVIPTLAKMLSAKLAQFPGTVGRCELMAQEQDVLYFDDYAHHPTEIVTTIGELQSRYPSRRILVIFAPHTASRTLSFLNDFVLALGKADRVIVQACFASARHDGSQEDDSGKKLAEALGTRIMRTTRCSCHAVAYAKDDEEAVALGASWLQPHDLCITMGAGNNRPLSALIAQKRRSL